LQADYVTVVENRPIMSVKYYLPVPIFHFWPKLTHPASRSSCDSWARPGGSCGTYSGESTKDRPQYWRTELNCCSENSPGYSGKLSTASKDRKN